MKTTNSIRALHLISAAGLLSLLTSVAAAAETALPKSAPDTNTPPGAAKPTPGGIQVAGELVVSLDARDPSAGTAVWTNQGTMGNFTRLGSPKLTTAGGQPAVQFNGTSDAYRSEKPTPATLTGAHARSIEVWVRNPSFDSTEECLVGWGHRGETLNNMAFNYGSGGGFSAVTHYDEDMSWGEESPAVGQWHYLVYTYDGKTAKIYADGVQQGSQDFALVTATSRMNIGVENSAEGEPLFQSEWDPSWPLAFSGYVATVRVHSGALTADQVKANYNAEKARFSGDAK